MDADSEDQPERDYVIYQGIEGLIKNLSPDEVLIKRLVFNLIGKLDIIKRTTLAFEIYTADFMEKPEETEGLDGEPMVTVSPMKDGGSQALRFWELELGDVFVCVPGPKDKFGNCGFRHTINVYRKIKISQLNNALDSVEMFNASRVTDGRTFTIHPASWVLKISI